MLLISDNITCAIERNMYYTFFGFNVLKISTKSKSSIVSFRISVALLIFCLEDLSTDVSEVLKSPLLLYSHPFVPLALLVFVFYISGQFSCAVLSDSL